MNRTIACFAIQWNLKTQNGCLTGVKFHVNSQLYGSIDRISILDGMYTVQLLNFKLDTNQRTICYIKDIVYAWSTNETNAYLSIPDVVQVDITLYDMCVLVEAMETWNSKLIQLPLSIIMKFMFAEGPPCKLIVRKIKVEGKCTVGCGPNLTKWVESIINCVTKQFFNIN